MGRMFKIKLGVLFLLCTLGVKSQMTTIYESGNSTSNYILTHFLTQTSFSTTGTPPPGQSTSSYNGYGADYLFKYPGHDNGMFFMLREIQGMNLYSDLEFYIEYQVNGASNYLSLMTSNDMSLNTIPNSSGNIVASNISSHVTVPYTNSNLDSILKIELEIGDVDSVLLQINYIRVSADLSSAVGIGESNSLKESVLVYTDGAVIKIMNKNNKPREIKVFNLMGQNVFSNKCKESLEIPLYNSSGIFIVHVTSAEGSFKQKVFLNN